MIPPENSSKQLALDIESQTECDLTIETQPTSANLAKCNPQSQSPLFINLPAEIRNEIFSLALAQYEDLSQPYKEHDFCYRPNHRARHRVSTNLLLTCRRVWLEANHCPMSQAIHTFWYDNDERRPTWTHQVTSTEDARVASFYKSLTPLQRSRVKHIHVYAQSYWLQRSVASSRIWRSLKHQGLKLDTFTVTLRHSDWWFWEDDHPLTCRAEGWLSELLNSPEARERHVAEFRLELETLAWKADQLRAIISNIVGVVRFNSECGGAAWDQVLPSSRGEAVTTWSGPTNLGGEKRGVYAGREKLDYVVFTLRWKLRDSTMRRDLKRRWQQEGSLLKLGEPKAEVNSWEDDFQGMDEDEESEDEDEDDEPEEEDDEDHDDDDGDELEDL